MKVLLVTSHAAPLTGGSGIVYDRLARASGDIGILASRVSYETGRDIPGTQAFDRCAPYFIKRVALLRPLASAGWRPPFDKIETAWRMLATTVHLLTTCARFKPDVICIGDLISLGWLVHVAQTLVRVPAILYVHGEEASYDDLSIFHRMRAAALRRADAVVAVSTFTADLLRTRYGVERVVLVPNGVDVAQFKPDAAAAGAFRRKHGIGERPLIVGLGRLVERKGFDSLVAAMPEVLRANPDAICLIAGTGPLEATLRGLIETSGTGENVRLLGFISDAEAIGLYSAADIFVMPNRTLEDGDTEGFGLVFLEANACGAPAIGGRAGGAVDAIEDGVSGFLLDQSTPAAVAIAINRILGDPVLKDALSRGALAWAAKSSWSAALEKFMRACHTARMHYRGTRAA